MSKVKFRFHLFLLTAVFAIASCEQEESEKFPNALNYSAYVNDAWVSTALKLVKETPGFSPPVAARTFGYMGLVMYESVRPGMPGYQSLSGQINGYTSDMLPNIAPQPYLWDVVANKAVFEVLKACFAGAKLENIDILTQKYEEILTTITNGDKAPDVEEALALGEQFGLAIAAYAESDGQVTCFNTNFPTDYQVMVGQGLWEPTSGQLIPLQPFWGNVRTFAPGSALVSVDPPLPYSEEITSPFYLEAKEVYDTYKNIKVRERVIAEYWSDDPGKTATPPGHSLSIARQVVAKEKYGLGLSAAVYARIGMAVHDAFVNCWKSKYEYNLVRPVTYIKKTIDPSFTTILATPPFPEYTSGHSVQSGATAAVLEGLFGLNYNFVDSTHAERTDINGAPRFFHSFEEFADEAAISRLYGGIHYRRAIDLGVDQGRKVGAEIMKIKFTR
ncbi:MAG: vanadium-dependent haloperoxidase [Saprospiraceae bacterium]|nr:vanadium-dependent haloperoxidase [Saprospiraceae bacterium]